MPRFKVGDKVIVLCAWVDYSPHRRTGFIGKIKDINHYHPDTENRVLMLNSSVCNIDERYIKDYELLPIGKLGNYLYG